MALTGVAGPLAFISAWTLGAVGTGMDYSSIDDAISRLAAMGADTRWLMTAGFVVFGISLPVFGGALRRTLTGGAWLAAVLTGLATLGVAATPLDRSAAVDTLHGIFATAGYVSLVAVPTGLLQRAGLSSTDVWLVIAASMMATGRLSDTRANDGR